MFPKVKNPHANVKGKFQSGADNLYPPCSGARGELVRGESRPTGVSWPTPFAPNSHASVSRLSKPILRKKSTGVLVSREVQINYVLITISDNNLQKQRLIRHVHEAAPLIVSGVDDPKDKKYSSLHFFLYSAVPIYDISYHKSDECLSHSHIKYLKSLISTSLKVASCAPGLMETEQVTGNSHFGVYCQPLTMVRFYLRRVA